MLVKRVLHWYVYLLCNWIQIILITYEIPQNIPIPPGACTAYSNISISGFPINKSQKNNLNLLQKYLFILDIQILSVNKLLCFRDSVTCTRGHPLFLTVVSESSFPRAIPTHGQVALPLQHKEPHWKKELQEPASSKVLFKFVHHSTIRSLPRTETDVHNPVTLVTLHSNRATFHSRWVFWKGLHIFELTKCYLNKYLNHGDSVCPIRVVADRTELERKKSSALTTLLRDEKSLSLKHFRLPRILPFATSQHSSAETPNQRTEERPYITPPGMKPTYTLPLNIL